MRRPLIGSCLIVATTLALVPAHTAHACGACVAPPPDLTQEPPPLVNSHRMVLSMSTDRTILWDQIRFAGVASEFAWILPVKPGATVELASDAWLDTLDAATTPQITPPDLTCEGAGCSVASAHQASFSCGDAGDEGAVAEPPIPEGVDVVSQESAGPYEIVILRSDSEEGLRAWLDQHDFAIPSDLDPIIDDYIEEGFDFAALRLVPAAGTAQMRPVRVTQPGAVPVLPLRMVTGGAGPRTPITLFVVSEAQYVPQNFPSSVMNPLAVTYDALTGTSNYAQVRDRLFDGAEASTWVISYSQPRALFQEVENPTNELPLSYRVSNGWSFETFYEAYITQGFINAETSNTDCFDALDEIGDDTRRVVDPCDEEGDCREIDEATEIDVRPLVCEAPIGSDIPFDDLAAALVGLHPADVWVTRLDANLAKEAMNTDLVLEPSPTQTTLSIFFRPAQVDNDPCVGQASVASTNPRTARLGVVIGVAAVAAMAVGRRAIRSASRHFRGGAR